MRWLIVAFISPILHGFANIEDNYLSNKLFKSVWTLTFYSVLFGALFLPLVFIFSIPALPPLHLLPYFIIIAAIEVLYLFPYYKSLQADDTSIVTSLFSLGRIFVPILAFIFVGEVLRVSQYVGFTVIVVGSAALTLDHPRGTLRFNKAFLYMLVCSTLLAIEAVIYKYLFETVSWSTGFVWTTLISFLFALCFLLIPKLRRDIVRQAGNFGRHIKVFAFEELLTFGGSAAAVYAISLVPVTLVEAVEAFQPLFVLFYAVLFERYAPRIFHEHIDRKSVMKKSLLFIIMVLGIYLVAR